MNKDISSLKRVTRKLKEVSRFSRAKQRQGNIQKFGARAKLFFANKKKKVCCTCKVFFFFLLIRSIVVVFYRFRCLHLVFSITRFYIFFEETINIKESFAFSPG